MRRTKTAGIVVAAVGVAALVACGRETVGARVPAVATATGDLAHCAGDSLRPATAAPAQGLWVSDSSASKRSRVVALIGPAGSDARTLEVRRLVETVEVAPAGDTIRTRRHGVSVTLELLPPLGAVTLGNARPDVRASAQPAATYVLSPRVRLAAYEACATSAVGPFVRYLRLDASGRTVTDVMLRRASGG